MGPLQTGLQGHLPANVWPPPPPAALLAPAAHSLWPAGLCSPEPVPQCSRLDLVAKRRGSPRAQTFASLSFHGDEHIDVQGVGSFFI